MTMKLRPERSIWKWRLWGPALLLAAVLAPGWAEAQWVINDTQTVTSDVYGSIEIGKFAGTTGTLNQNAYTAHTEDPYHIYLGVNASGSGTYNLSGTGHIFASNELVGQGGTGVFNQSGGTNEFNKHVGEWNGWGYTEAGSLYLGYSSGSSGTYNLSDGSLWVPQGSVTVGKSGRGTFNQTGGTNSGYGSIAMTLILGSDTSGRGTYTLQNGQLSAISEYIGRAGSGDFVQSGGTNTVSTYLHVGQYAGSTGSYNLQGGSLYVGNYEYVGSSGQGAFTQSGGTNNSSYIYVGYSTGASGSYDQSGGTNTVRSYLILGHMASTTGSYNLGSGNLSAYYEIIGSAGTGSFTQSGGIHTVDSIIMLGSNSGSSGSYTMDGGNLTLGNGKIYVGYYGNATFTQTGGSVTVNRGDLTLGYGSGSNGTYTMSDGSLRVNNFLNVGAPWSNSGSNGSGTFNQTGGTVSVGSSLYIGTQGPGTYNMSGGSLSIGNQLLFLPDFGGGVFNQSGGTVTTPYFTNGVYNLSGGILNVSDYESGNGSSNSFVQSGGTHNVGTDLGSGGLEISENGTYELRGASSRLTVTGGEYVGGYDTGSFTQRNGSHTVAGGLYVGIDPWGDVGSGTFTLNGGTLVADNEYIGGNSGSAPFTQTGGSHRVTGSLYLGYETEGAGAGTGTYTLGGGTLAVTAAEYVGHSGSGSFTQTGGTHTVGGNLYLGYNAGMTGTYELNDGSLTTGSVFVGHSGSGVFNQTGGTHTVTASLSLGQNAGSSGTYSLVNSNLSVGGNEAVGYSGSGAFSQILGSHTAAADLYLGYNAGGSGTYSLGGGTLTVGGNEMVGRAGTGTFTQSGGSHTVAGYLNLGNDAGGSGSYSLDGGGILAVGGNESLGYSGSGSFTQTDGAHTAANLLLGYNAGGSGSYSLNGGGLTVNSVSVGNSGSGSFTQSGGTHTAGYSYIGYKAGSTGTYNLSGGSLGIGGNQIVGESGSGTFTQSGGTHTTTIDLTLGYQAGASGTYQLTDGGLGVTANEVIGLSGSGAFTQSGGTNIVTGDLVVGYNAGGSGTFNLTGGTLSAKRNEVVAFSGSGAFTQSGGSHTVAGTLIIGYNSGTTGTYSLSAPGSLTAVNEYLGNSGSGSFTQTGGAHGVTDLYLGVNAGSTGTYNLSGGSLLANISTYHEYIGNSGSGSFTQTGGINVAANLYLGINSGGSGTYNLSGGTLGSAGGTGGDEYIGLSGGGSFTQTSSTNTATNLYLGYNAGGSGVYNLSGGTLTVSGKESVGESGNGIFTQSSGSHTVAADLFLGNRAGSNGTYSLQGGASQLSVTGNEFVGCGGGGAFTQDAGSHTVTGVLDLGNTYASVNGSGAYTQNGGSLQVNGGEVIGDFGRGTFTQSAGTHTVAAVMGLGNMAGSSGAYTQSGGLLKVGGASSAGEYVGYSGSGVFTQSGGSHRVAGDLVLGFLPGGAGAYNLSGTGSLAVTGNAYVGNAGPGTFTQTGGSHTVTGILTIATSPPPLGSDLYALQGGNLTVGTVNLNSGGVFVQTGGGLNATIFNQSGGEVQGSLESRGTFNYNGGTFAGRLLNYGAVNFNADFTASNGLVNYSTTPLDVGAGRTVILNGAGLDNQGTLNLYGVLGGTLLNNTTGTLNQYAGSTLQNDLDNQGIYNYFGGTLSGQLFNRGVANFNGDLTVGGLNVLPGGSLVVEPGTTMTVAAPGLINQGNLVINGTLTGSPLINDTGGIFSGSGTVLGSFTNRGTINPGNSPGTITVVGNYTQTASGIQVVEIASATNYDKLQVTGSATINGTLKPVLLGGYTPVVNQIFTSVLTAPGGVSGTFSAIANPANQVWKAIYTANSVDLLLEKILQEDTSQTAQSTEPVRPRNYADASFGLDSNQMSVGRMLNGLAGGVSGDLAAVMNSLDNLPNARVGDALRQLSPEMAGSMASLGFTGAYSQFHNLAQRITNLRFANLGMGSAFGGGRFSLTGSKLDGLMLAYNGSNIANLLTGKKEAAPESRYGLYLQPNLILGSQSTTANQTGFSFTTAGFTLGADYKVSDSLLLGLASGYSHTGAGFRNSGGSNENNSWPILAYGAYLPGPYYAFGSLGYSLNFFNLERNIAFEAINRTAKSSTVGNQFNAYAESGYDLKWNWLVVTPNVSLAYSRLWLNGFSENGAGSLNLKVDPQNAESLQSGVGAKVAAVVKTKAALIVPQIYATWQHEFSNNSRGLDARLSQGSTPLTWQTEKPQRDFAVVGGNVTVGLQKNFTLQVDYNAEVGRANATAHSITAGLRWEF
jgi:uncharacterized protein with beta-barrel porin domain